MTYGILTHKKIGSVHNLYLDINMSKTDFLIETSFYAESDYRLGESFRFNDTPMTEKICPEVDALFNAEDCVYCVIDLLNNVIVITDVHKANFDSLIVFNNFSNNPEGNFTSQNNVLFSTGITINNQEKEYADVLLGGCVILEDSMSEDGIAPLSMNIEILIDGEIDFKYNIDCTRKHEIINFDHTLKNLKTNKNTNIVVRYYYDNYKYGSSYVGPSIKNNNVTIYLEGSNIMTSSANIFHYKLETVDGNTYAVIDGILDLNCLAYRFPNVYVDSDGTSYPVKKVYLSNSCYLNNAKFISFASGIEYLDLSNLYPYGTKHSSSYNYTNYQIENTIKDDYTIVVFPDEGLKYVYRGYSNAFINRENITMHGDPNDVLVIYNYFPITSILPSGEYPEVTIDNFKVLGYPSGNNFGKSNIINLEGYFVPGMRYKSFENYNYSAPYGLARLTTSEDNWMMCEPSNDITFNIKSKYCSLYYAIDSIYLFMHRCDNETAEKFHFECDDEDVFVYIHHITFTFNVEGDVIYYRGYINYPLNNTTGLWLSDEYCPFSSVGFSTSLNTYNINNIDFQTYMNQNMISSYYRSGNFQYGNIDDVWHCTLPRSIVNIKGNVYSYPYSSMSYIYDNKVIIDGNLYGLPTDRPGSGYRYMYYNSTLGNSYKSNMYLYYYKRTYATCIVNGTYDLSKNMYSIMLKAVNRASYSYDENGNSITSGYYTRSAKSRVYFEFGRNKTIKSPLYYSLSKSDSIGIKKFHADVLEGIVSIPYKATYNGYSSYSIPSLDGAHSYATIYMSSMCEFSFKEIKPDTMILNFGNQNLEKLDIDFTKLAGIGELKYCNLISLKLPTPVVVIFTPPDNSMHRCVYYSKSETNENYEYYYDDTEDHLWDPDWRMGNTYSSIKYDIEIEFNAMVLGDIYLKYVPLTKAELEPDIYATTIFRNNTKLKEKAMVIEERLSLLDEDERPKDYTGYKYYEISEISKPVLPKNSDIANGIENFEFDYNSSFRFSCSYDFDSSTGKFTVYPKIKLYDVTRYIGSGFLNDSPYIINQDPDILELPKQLKFYGAKTFNFRFLESVYNEEQGNYTSSYYNAYNYGWANVYYTDYTLLKTLRRYLKEVKIGKYLESMENNVFPFADKCTIDPENPNFVIENGYIFNKDKTILYRPVCYTEFSKYTDNNDEYIFKSSTLKKIVDRTSFKYDDRITGIEITSSEFEIADLQGYSINKQDVLEMPDNCSRIILPSGLYTIRDEDFEKMEYIEFINITPTSKYYNIPGSLANDIYTNYSTTINAYADYIKNTNASAVNAFSFSLSGTRMIFAKKNMIVNLPDVCTEIGGKLNIDTLEISSTRDAQFNISNSNLRISNYTINEDGNSIFSTKMIGDKSSLWYNTTIIEANSGYNKYQLLYRFPNAADEDIVNISLDNIEKIDTNAFKYCDIKEINISSPNRDTNIFCVPSPNERSVPVSVFNAYKEWSDDPYKNMKRYTYYEDKYISNKYQYATASTSDCGTSCKYRFAQPYYYKYNDHNILALPIRNDMIESLTIDFDPKFLFGEFYNSEYSGVSISYGWQRNFTSKYANSVSTYVIYDSGTYIINSFALPPINKMYINYNFGTDLKCKFPVLPSFNEIHFDESNLDTVVAINKLVVCNPDAKIYPEALLTKIDTIHNYELYYNTNTNLYLTQTEYTDCVFGEKCGAPFPSDSTITLDNCFVHSLFVHPSCENINLIIKDNCRFGYCTDFLALNIGESPNIYNQYADYVRTFKSSNYTTGNELGDINRVFFLLSPALAVRSMNEHMEKIFTMFSSITSPRLFSFQYTGDVTYDDKYKLGGFYKITQDILYIPKYCFYVNCTKNSDGEYCTSGYDLFEYSQFKTIVSTLKNIGTNNKFRVPTNPDGETIYEFSSSFKMWEGCFCASMQDYIDEWIINSNIVFFGGSSEDYYNRFTGGNLLQYFVKKFTFKTTDVNFYFNSYRGGIDSYTERDYPNYNPTQHHTINITKDNSIIDIGCIPCEHMLENYDYVDDAVTTYGKQTFELTFDSSVTNVSINQLQVPNMHSEILDFSAYPDITFTLGTKEPMTTDSENSDYWIANLVKISGFKKVVMSDNVSMYGNLPSCPFYWSAVETIEFKSGQLYSATSCANLKTIIFADSYTEIDQFYVGTNNIDSTIESVNLDNIITLIAPSNPTYSGISYAGQANFVKCKLTSVNLDSLKTINDSAGFNQCTFTETLDCPVLETIGNTGFKQSKGVKVVNLPKCTTIGDSGFYDSPDITTINAPLLDSVGESCFYSNKNLSTLNAPILKTIGNKAFQSCNFSGVLTLESAETIGDYAFDNNIELTEVHLPKCKSVGANAFYSCTKIKKAYIPTDCNIEATSFYNSVEIDRTLY